ncbi:MAG: hypothetical protein ACOCT9_00785, partial [archaeon]
VIQRIVSDHKLNKEGEVDENIEAKIHSIKYICGRCGCKVREIQPEEIMNARITKVNSSYVYGEFKNKLRGKEIFEFVLYKKTGKIEIEGISSVKVERDFIREYYKLHYIKNIQTKIVDYTLDKVNNKTYEIELYNPDEEVEMVLFVKDNKIIDYTGDRKPNETEIKKAIEKAEHSPY